jgi:hypothetical protein
MTDDAMGHLLHNIFAAPAEPGPPYTHTFSPLAPDPAEAVAWLREQISWTFEYARTVAQRRPVNPARSHEMRDLLADCEAKRGLLDICERVIHEDEGHEYYSDGWSGLAVARITLRHLAFAYRHREGYAAHWSTPPTHTITEVAP